MEISLLGAAQLLKNTNHLVLTAHIHPDGDCLGSLLGLYAGLKDMGKQVEILLDDTIPQSFSFLPGVDKIVRPQDHIEADLLIILDSSDAERTGRVIKTVQAPTLNIDHHVSNTHFTNYWYIDENAAATGEIVFELLQQMNQQITPDIATCLYTAIATDCGFFRYANTTPKTLHLAAELVQSGAKPSNISQELDTKPLSYLSNLTKVLDTLEVMHFGKIACLSVFPEVLEALGDSTEDLVNYPRNIAGVEIAILFKLKDNNVVRVSMRSKSVDVSQIALSFGGGGHKRAAGCTICRSYDQAHKEVIAKAVAAIDGTNAE